MPKKRNLKELFPRVFRWTSFHRGIGSEVSSYLVVDRAGVVLVDPALPSPAILGAIRDLAAPDAIVLTTSSHARQAARCRRAFRCPLYAHEAAAERLRLRDVETFTDGAGLPAGMQAVWVPGATEGECALYYEASDPAAGVFFVGDVLVNLDAKQGLSLLPAEWCADPKRLERSVRRLLRYDFDRLCLSHGEPVLEGAKKKVRALLERKKR